MQAIGLDVQILNEDGEEVVIKELDDEDEIEQDQSQQDEIRDVMEETNTASAGVPQEKAASDTDDNGDDEYVDAGEEDDIMSSMTYETIPGQSDDMTDNEE